MTRQLRISAWAIRNPTPVALLFIALLIAGMISYLTMPVKQFPNVEFPMVAVTATLSGAAPAEMESQITRPIENALAGLSNISSMTSTVTEGVSSTTIEFEIGEDLQKATDDVQAQVDQVRVQLPREVDPPLVQRIDVTSTPIITYAVSAPDMSLVDLSWFIDDTVSRNLQGVPGVARISRFGGLNREINIILDPVRMAAQGVTAPQVNQALTAVTIDAPGGRTSIGGREQTVRVLGAATTIEQVRALSIPVNGREVRLSDVAEIGDGSNEVRRYARLDGRPAVGFEVIKTKDSSDVKVEDGVDAALQKLQAANPGVKVEKIFSIVQETRDSYHATLATLGEGMFLASLVVFAFLWSWRATAVTAIAMPVSLIPTFAVMGFMGFSLNVVTLLALTLVIGILVDDAIVEIENIEKRVHMGARPYYAALEGADQIGLAVVATTFSILVVFLPVSFMPGIPGQFFKEFGLTVSIAVLFSLLVARLLTPLLAAYFLKPKEGKPRRPLPRAYVGALNWTLNHRILSCLIGFALFAGLIGGTVALVATGRLPVGLSPETDFDFYQLNIETAPGATLAETSRAANAVAALVGQRPETKHVFMQVGASSAMSSNGMPSTASGSNRATVTAVLKPEGRPKVWDIRDDLRPKLASIPDARVSFISQSFGSGGANVILTSDSGEGLDGAALALQQQMRAIPILAAPRNLAPPSGPELVIRPRLDEAARLGVSVQTIAQTARIATAGDIDANVPKLTEGARRLPIRVRLPESFRTDLASIRNLQVPTITGEMTSLESVADVEFRAGPGQIDRFDRKRQVTVQADLVGGAQLGDADTRIMQLPVMKNLPAGVTRAVAGEQQAMGQLFLGFIVAILSGVGLVYGVMALLFHSFLKPLTIMLSLPLALIGAVIALVVTGLQIDMPSLIGFLMLMGLSAKNSILLVEYAIEGVREGKPRREAILEACRERARPIVMTSLAMIAGMAPTALALGAGSEFRQPMAVAVIGGLISSTVLSLVLVPVAYEVIDMIENWLKPKLGRLLTPREAPEGPSVR